MAKVILDEQDKDSVEQLISSVLTTLHEQLQCGIQTVSTNIEIGALEEIKRRVSQLGQRY